jgi:hypothetical protein
MKVCRRRRTARQNAAPDPNRRHPRLANPPLIEPGRYRHTSPALPANREYLHPVALLGPPVPRVFGKSGPACALLETWTLPNVNH